MSSFGYDLLGFGSSANTAVATPSDDEFNRVPFLSHFDGANNGVNNAFDDGSASNHTMTAEGNVPLQGSFGPFARPDGEWAVDFDGDGDSLTFTNDATMSLDGDYTFELFFNATAIVIDTQHPNTWLSGTTQLFIHASDRYVSWYAGSADIVKSADNAILTNVWNHVAVVRSGTGSNNTSLYLNGTRVAQTQNTATLGASSGTARIGSYSASGGNFDGQISNLRILKGTALYSGSSITVPTSKLTAVSNTKLLTCQSNRFVDNSASAHTITSAAASDASVSAFGPFLTDEVYDPEVNGASAYFDGLGTLRSASSNQMVFSTGDFTIEFWAYHTIRAHANMFPATSRDSINSVVNGDFFFQGNTTTNEVRFKNDGGTQTTLQDTSGPFPVKQWFHTAAVKEGSALTYYRNGVRLVTASVSGTFGRDNSRITIGKFSDSTAWYWSGYIADFRVLKGTAKYSGATYTVPTVPLTAITNTSLLLNMADGQAINRAAQNNMTLIGGAKISTGQAKFGDTSMYFDGASDHAKFPNTQIGTGDFTIECWVRCLGSTYDKGIWDNHTSSGSSDGLTLTRITEQQFRLFGTGELIRSGNFTITNTWVNVTVVRSSGTLNLFVNGVSQGTTSFTTNLNSVADFVIGGGRYSGDPTTGAINAYVDEFRISHTARYPNNFTVSNEPFADKGQ